MHLLLAQKGSIADGGEAVDLGQSSGDILFLSAADTELAGVAAAADGWSGPSLRLASLMSLKHPMSVDTYVEKTLRHAKLVVVRALGGTGYFQYLLEAFYTAAERAGALIVALPGDDRPDPALADYSNVSRADYAALHSYLVEGGEANARGFLDYCAAMLASAEKPAPATPLLKAGIWWPGQGVVGVEAWRSLSPLDGEMSRQGQRGVSSRSAVGHPPLSALPTSPPQGGRLGDCGTVAICFYRALVQSGETAPVAALVDALAARGLKALPVFVASLKDAVSQETVRHVFGAVQPDVVINATGFAVSPPGATYQPGVLDEGGAVVLQAVFSSSSKEAWEASPQGLSARDLAMHVSLTETDGRVMTRAVSFKAAARFDERVQANIVSHVPEPGRVGFVTDLAANWVRLRRKPAAERRVAIVLANYPNRDGRLGNGVGLDTPAGTVEVLNAMAGAGYPVTDIPTNSDRLMDFLMAGPTNAGNDGREIRETLSLSHYKAFFAKLPKVIQAAVTAKWGGPERDPYVVGDVFALPMSRLGDVAIGIQPARGYNIDPKETYHSPDLVPPHGYFAFYAWLRESFGADAVVHMGKHGNLEWLPGKALALSETCYPEAVFGPLPQLYPFIVNDPGEGTQAKRRTSAVIIDHLTPPLTRAESYGPLKDLEALVDEYYQAAGGDPRRLTVLRKKILDLVTDIGLDHDAGIVRADDADQALVKLDAWLCDLKEMQIRDGLHVFGVAPEGRLLTDLCVALARVPRGLGEGGDQSLQRAIAVDSLSLSPLEGEMSAKPTEGGIAPLCRDLPPSVPDGTSPPQGGRLAASVFDPLDCTMSDLWAGSQPAILADLSADPWRTNGDTVERIELLAVQLVSGEVSCPEGWTATHAVLDAIESRLKPSVIACGPAEIEGLLRGLDGRFVPPGPSGAPTRGRPDVLPTGRNFYSVDSRAVPTQTAWELGRKSAELLVTRYVQDHGDWPKSFALTAWGTSNMRTGGDDIAQGLALIGVKPVWDTASLRVTGYEVIPVAQLGRPRVDVTLRISGFFRDAFPEQIALFDKAVRAVGGLDEDAGDNPIAARMRGEQAALVSAGMGEAEAARKAGFRVFGSKPGAYGAGLQALIDEKGWDRRGDLAESYLVWGSYAYGAGEEGVAERGLFETRLSTVEAVIQNQDNREHDLLDSDDYYQFEGGMSAAVEHLKGSQPAVYHNDHSRPEKPVIRSLEEEISRVVRGRVVNPKWIAGVMRHDYKGAFEITATVDYMFAFSATTGAVKSHHFEAAYQAFIADEAVRDFMRDKNAPALTELAERFIEALDRGLWEARSNSARFELERLAGSR
ncbi:cobaltochelatase subunit CobN [Rhizobium sp. C4]|uniref:cobaltochelatase subunit CobN n=1 Tax=Rhizobium sp. C4 TaxID=1349800 RepID=UPI001E52372B|nr:cobaltochelatase subunit CobN [Rhizobium sp. C4]MCD2173301.1 cobaltochelatase subunit CobN [Rhizobium sp. C4]